MPLRVAIALRRLHAGPRFRDDFDMFRLAEGYLRLCDERSFPVPDGYRELVGEVGRIEAAFAVNPFATVPCHNDLLADNYLDDGRHLRIVDYEYSGNNDPTFELGNTCQELGWDDDRGEALCAAYFGRATPALLARMRLNMIMSDVGCTLWAAIQARISPIDYDFRAGLSSAKGARARPRLAFGAGSGIRAPAKLGQREPRRGSTSTCGRHDAGDGPRGHPPRPASSACRAAGTPPMAADFVGP